MSKKLQMQRPAPPTPAQLAVRERELRGLFDQAGKEGYRIGLNVGFAWQGITETEATLRSRIQSVVNFVIATEGLPSDWQARRLRELLSIDSNRSVDKHLLDAIDDLRQAILVGLPILNQMDYGEEHPFDSEYAEYLIGFGLELKDAVAALTRNIEPDLQARELLEVIRNRGGENVLNVMEQMRLKAPKLGAASGPDEVTRIIGEYALSKVPNWGTRWSLIGKRHHEELSRIEHPTSIEQEVIKKYRAGGIKTGAGKWEWRSKYLTDTVRNAYRAVGGS